MNKITKLMIVVFLVIFMSSIINAPFENSKKKVEKEDMIIECDKEEYKVISGISYAYCKITNKKNGNLNTDIYSVLEQEQGVNIGNIYYKSEEEWLSLETSKHEDARNFKGKKTKSKVKIDKESVLELKIELDVTSNTVSDEFWLGTDTFELDPAVTGCDETATAIMCNDSTFTGDYIDTTKNIIIRNATILENNGFIRLNSTNGYITISNSIVNAIGSGGSTGSTANGGCGDHTGGTGGVGQDGILQILSFSILTIENSTLSSLGGTGGAGGSSSCTQSCVSGWSSFNGGDGGAGGIGETIFNATYIYIDNETTIQIDGGEGGNGGIGSTNDACDNPRGYSGCTGGNGGTGKTGYMNTNSKEIKFYNNTEANIFRGTGGAGGGTSGSCSRYNTAGSAGSASYTNVYLEAKDEILFWSQTFNADYETTNTHILNLTGTIPKLGIFFPFTNPDRFYVYCPNVLTNLQIGNYSTFPAQWDTSTCTNIEYITYNDYFDSANPTYTNFQNNGTNSPFNSIVQWSADLTDDSNINYYIFAHNQTGTLTNQTKISVGASNPSITYNLTITKIKNNYICGKFWFNDTLGYSNQTNLSCFTVANTIPSIPNLISPVDLSSVETGYAILEYNSTDPDNATDIITFYIYNSTDDITFSLLFNGSSYSNSSYNWSGLADDDYYWKVKAGDGTGNSSNSSSYKFTISTTSPAINLQYPTNNLWFNTRNITSFNFSTIDSDGLLSCNLWHNLSGTWEWNQSNSSTITNDGTTHYAFAGANNTIDEHSYAYNVNCSDILGNAGFSANNFTFYIDTVDPVISITQPTGTFSTKVDITLAHTATDFSLSECEYNVTYKATGNQVIANKIITCNQNENFTVDTYSDYTVSLKVTDSAGNVKITSNDFTVEATAPPQPVTPGGGGGAPPAVTQCETDEDCEVFGDKYVCIQNFCIYQEFESVCNYDGICSAERGENLINCGDVFVNNTLVLSGDCSFADLPRIALSSQYVLYSIIGLIIIGTITFNQMAKKPEQRFKAFRIPKKFFRRKK